MNHQTPLFGYPQINTNLEQQNVQGKHKGQHLGKQQGQHHGQH